MTNTNKQELAQYQQAAVQKLIWQRQSLDSTNRNWHNNNKRCLNHGNVHKQSHQIWPYQWQAEGSTTGASANYAKANSRSGRGVVQRAKHHSSHHRF
jgi:hypothetical protein